MTPYYTDAWLTIYGGDCLDVMATLPPDSVDCVVTSPPYWGLRDYGTATWEGGDAECDHLGSPMRTNNKRSDPTATFHGGGTRATEPWKDGICGKCGAIRIDSQLGLERTPEEYVANMVNVFREVRRVLKPSGTCWLNLGDSYAGPPVGTFNGGGFKDKSAAAGTRDLSGIEYGSKRSKVISGLKPKDLVGIPWRVAFALRADGWYLRSDIIWSKPNPMPESVTDRPTKSHEYLFLLTKSARYYFDADAVREPHIEKHLSRYGYDFWPEGTKEANGGGRPDGASNTGGAKQPNPLGRNIRSVWTIATRPYPGAHFAVFPPELPERCIKAGSSEKGVCPECGAPWERVVERHRGPIADVLTPKDEARASTNGWGQDRPLLSRKTGLAQPGWRKEPRASFETVGWDRKCGCGPGLAFFDPVPAVILDPFAGSGTVGMVANRLSRRAILIDLNPEYLKQQMRRNAQTPLGLPA